jgi:hypothetical protein
MIADLSKKPKKGMVRVLPVPGWYIPGVPDLPQDVEPEVAAELLSYTPAAFVLDEPAPEGPPTQSTKE